MYSYQCRQENAEHKPTYVLFFCKKTVWFKILYLQTEEFCVCSVTSVSHVTYGWHSAEPDPPTYWQSIWTGSRKVSFYASLQTSFGLSSKCPHTLEPMVPRFRILGENRHFLNNGKKQLNNINLAHYLKIRMNFKIPTVLWLLYVTVALKSTVISQKTEEKNCRCHLEGHWRKSQDPESNPDPNPGPLVRGTGPRIRIRIRTKL